MHNNDLLKRIKLRKDAKSSLHHKLQFDWKYKTGQMSSNKTVQITTYLLHSINPITRSYSYTIKGLMNKFDCSKATVYNSISLLRKVPLVRYISKNQISLKKGDDLHD